MHRMLMAALVLMWCQDSGQALDGKTKCRQHNVLCFGLLNGNFTIGPECLPENPKQPSPCTTILMAERIMTQNLINWTMLTIVEPNTIDMMYCLSALKNPEEAITFCNDNNIRTHLVLNKVPINANMSDSEQSGFYPLQPDPFSTSRVWTSSHDELHFWSSTQLLYTGMGPANDTVKITVDLDTEEVIVIIQEKIKKKKDVDSRNTSRGSKIPIKLFPNFDPNVTPGPETTTDDRTTTEGPISKSPSSPEVSDPSPKPGMSGSKEKLSTTSIALIVLSVVLVILIVLFLMAIFMRKKNKKATNSVTESTAMIQ